jgi:hypothetical protein
MKIQLKRSGVLENGAAKRPTPGQTEYGELCVNYNAGDPTIFIKDSTDEIIPIAGDSHVVELIKENAQITISLGPPPNPENNDLWLDTSVCPPRLMVWSDCEGGNGQWFPLGGSEVIQFPLSISSDNGNQLNATLTAVGGDGVSAQGNPIEPTYTWTGAKSGNGKTIVADIVGIYSVKASIVSGSREYIKTATTEIIDSYIDPVPLAAPIIAVEGGGRPQPGKTIVITANGTVSFGLQPYVITKNMWYKDGQLVAEGETYEVTSSDVNSELELYQEITDGRNTAVVVGPSNRIEMVDYLGYIVTPAVVSPTDGSGSGNDIALRSDKITEVEEFHLTVASEINLDNPGFVGSVIMTAGDTNPDGSYAVATYTPFSSPITGVNTSGNAGDVLEVQDGTDMPYFRVGQEIDGKTGNGIAYATITADGDHAVDNLSRREHVVDGNSSTFFAFRQGGDQAFSAYMAIRFGSNNGKIIYPKAGDVLTITANSNSKSYACYWGWDGNPARQPVTIGTGKTSYTWTVPNSFDKDANAIRLYTARKSDGTNDYVKVYTLTINGSLTGGNGNQGQYEATGIPVSITNINPEQRLFTVTKGASWSNGETFEGDPVTGTGEIQSIDIDQDKINLSVSGGKWVGPNLAGVDFFVAGPIVNDTPLLTTDVELRCSPFKTDPSDIANLSNIVWEIDGTTEDAGTSNPYKPTGLSPNTTHTVRVKHQSTELEDSAWSATSSFTTGASRSIYEYQQSRINELMTRIETLENNSDSSY